MTHNDLVEALCNYMFNTTRRVGWMASHDQRNMIANLLEEWRKDIPISKENENE